MTPASIVSAIKTALEDSSYLSYINDNSIFLGVRDSISVFPCIIIEPIGNTLTDEAMPNEYLILNINITAYIQVYDKEKQIVGDTQTKGVLDVENDIKKALSSNSTLGLAEVIDTKIVNSVHDFEQYPVRGFAINLEVHYKQNRTTRA